MNKSPKDELLAMYEEDILNNEDNILDNDICLDNIDLEDDCPEDDEEFDV